MNIVKEFVDPSLEVSICDMKVLLDLRMWLSMLVAETVVIVFT